MNEIADLNIALVGESCVGKTAIALRFVNNDFNNNLPSTIHFDSFNKTLNIDGKDITFSLRDTAGQEQYRSIIKLYYRNCQVIIIVFALGNLNPTVPLAKESFNSIGEWYRQIKNNADEGTIIVLCGNMNDLQLEITHDEVMEKIRTIDENLEYFETSAKTNDGIDAMFETIAERYLQSECFIEHEKDKSNNFIDIENEEHNNRRCC
ncbi:Ras-related protein Rab-5A [Histomonas meleagridis]|uniref:Ras-related protein Rab-5A n=1 Tax=Histomonas meleagridis TaxID=135588 RepID=UPI0035596950|nr:Ras-related protein Rab-5A [Histomonas meleagridis]KAH0802700.1 Ras-related protein Rab-5A [Histomonas meleagridis]